MNVSSRQRRVSFTSGCGRYCFNGICWYVYMCPSVLLTRNWPNLHEYVCWTLEVFRFHLDIWPCDQHLTLRDLTLRATFDFESNIWPWERHLTLRATFDLESDIWPCERHLTLRATFDLVSCCQIVMQFYMVMHLSWSLSDLDLWSWEPHMIAPCMVCI